MAHVTYGIFCAWKTFKSVDIVMSTRALRKLHGGQALPDVSHLSTEDDNGDIVDEGEVSPVLSKKTRNRRKNLSEAVNPFELLNDELEIDNKDEDESFVENEQLVLETQMMENRPQTKRKKHKKKKNKTASVQQVNAAADYFEDEIEASIHEVNQLLGEIPQSASASRGFSQGECSVYKNVLNVEHRYLNPANEMKRIFGARVVQTDNNRNRHQRHRMLRKNTYLVQPKDTWPHLGKSGLSMELVETNSNGQHFVFVHNKEYQKVQFQFLDAVESLNPQIIIDMANSYPHHIDTLLQVSEICKMSEDVQMAADFIERALYVFECAFHPLFSLTQGTARLNYKQQENRAFYLAVFRHLNFIGKRGCYRTALELCKLLLSLDPEGDPLCVLLMIDFFALRSEQYQFLIRLFQEWEAHRNLSQLPNFAFSVPLAMFHQAIEDKMELSVADEMLQNSLVMFPGLLHPLLNKCSVAPDAQVVRHSFFGPKAQLRQPKALEQLISLYVGRTFSCWKSTEVIGWLERNVHEVLSRVDNNDPLVEQYQKKRQRIYQGTPKNIHRHIIIADVQEAVAALPPDLAHMPVMSYDPLPPDNSVAAYKRPSRPNRAQASSNTLALFFQSLLPNFNPEEAADPASGALGRDAQNFREGIGQVMEAMRDLLTNIRPVPPPVENADNREEEQPNDDNDDHH